jgi:hypothetical protein
LYQIFDPSLSLANFPHLGLHSLEQEVVFPHHPTQAIRVHSGRIDVELVGTVKATVGQDGDFSHGWKERKIQACSLCVIELAFH